VIGGSGMLGRPVVNRLEKDGFDVTVLSTSPDSARTRLPADVPVVYGDATLPETLRNPIADKDAVYVNLSSKLDPEVYRTVEVAGTANVGEVCRKSGVARLLLISSATSRGVTEGPVFLSAKVQAEVAVKNSGVPYTIMRPSWFFESLPSFVGDDCLELLGTQSLPRRWLAADDYARQVSAALGNDLAVDKCLYNFGPDAVSIRDALRQFHVRVCPDLPFRQVDTKRAEQGDSAEAERIVGSNPTTLETWIDRYLQS
jgi:uncharacterized protein YbjT (DUF2867 family)